MYKAENFCLTERSDRFGSYSKRIRMINEMTAIVMSVTNRLCGNARDNDRLTHDFPVLLSQYVFINQ